MYTIIGIILALTVFTAVVFFHELGHFLTAKLSKMKVEEFWIGIPPRMVRLFSDRSGTEYTINYLPIGGFVKIKGESSDGGKADPDSFVAQSYLAKSIVLLAGVFMNFLFAWIVLSVLFFVWVSPLGINSKFPTDIKTLLVPTFEQAIQNGFLETDGVILGPLSWSVAERAGIQEWDILRKVDNQTVWNPEDFIRFVKAGKGMKLSLERNKNVIEVPVLPENGKIGAYVGFNVIRVNAEKEYKFPIREAIVEGFIETKAQIMLTFDLFEMLVKKLFAPQTPTDRKEATETLSGPIAIGSTFIDLAKANVSITVILVIAALISINLWVFNLLPFPALDGGRFFFLTISSLLLFVSRGKWSMDTLEARAHMIGFALLLVLSIFVAYNDIIRLL